MYICQVDIDHLLVILELHQTTKYELPSYYEFFYFFILESKVIEYFRQSLNLLATVTISKCF